MGHENTVLLPEGRRRLPAASLLVPSVHWVDVRDQAAAALLGGTRRLLVTGPAGTGKTVLVEHVARILRAAGRQVTVQLADAEPAAPAEGETLFVDEADRLSPAKRRELQAARGVVLLAGLGTTPPRRSPAGTVQLTLAPLGREAARDYIAEWLAVHDRSTDDLDSAGVRRLVELSGGVPRLLAALLAASAWVAATSGAAVIGAGHVQEAAELRSIDGRPEGGFSPTPRRPRAIWSVLLAILVGGVAAAAVAPRLWPGGTALVVAQVTDWVRDTRQRVMRATDQPPPPVARVVPPSTPAIVAEPAPALVPMPSEPVAAVPDGAATAAAPMAEAPAAAEPAPAAMPALSAETVDLLLRRGREMLHLDDVSAARLLFRRAADGGSAEAMLQLGQTFDPAYVARVGSDREADHAEMLEWYRRAAASGNAAAAARLENLSTR